MKKEAENNKPQGNSMMSRFSSMFGGKGTNDADKAKGTNKKLGKNKKEEFTIEGMQNKVKDIIEICTNKAVLRDINRLSDQFMYAETGTSEYAKDTEENIREMLEQLREIVNDGSVEDIKTLISDISFELADRNRICSSK